MRVQYNISAESRGQHEGAEHGGGTYPSDAEPKASEHFTQRISDSVAVCFDSLLEQGVRKLTFVEVAHMLGHILGVWNEEKN